jgi:P4 family phage/plasmid primase-like protien
MGFLEASEAAGRAGEPGPALPGSVPAPVAAAPAAEQPLPADAVPVYLSETHRMELAGSVVSDGQITARGYRTLDGSDADKAGLKEIRIPRWAWREDSAFPGLLIPMYRVTGERIGYQWKPAVPQEAPGGKREKYASQSGTPNRLDVPPSCSDSVRDPSVPLWITEGVKKADALCSKGRAVVTLTGVFNWRSKHGTLGDWEDIPLRDRTVVVCFDADAREKRNVLLAMRRLGMWLESKGVSDVRYLIVPAESNGVPVKGVDDFFAAGGTMAELAAVAMKELPADGAQDAAFSDAVLTDTVCREELDGRFCWASGLGWMTWTGKIWEGATDATVTEAVRLWALEAFNTVLDRQRQDHHRDMRTQIDGWRGVLSAGRLGSLVRLARGVLECKPDDFDSDPDMLNCPNGILDLRTGELQPHDPDQLMTKIAGCDYVKGATHPDWTTALTAMPGDMTDWFQLRMGQAITGHMTPDDLAIICQGGGQNGKSTISDACAEVAGKYHVVVSDRAMLGGASDNHPTEMMDFMGARYAVLEETPESRRLDTNRLKKLTGTREITARRIRQDSVTFEATHSLFVNSNYKPVVDETDHGTWRRLALVRFPYTYRTDPAEIRGPMDRLADPTLRQRVQTDPQVKEAVLAWMVAGAQRWYDLALVMPQPPDYVMSETRKWRMESDPVLHFIEDHLAFDYDSHVISPELRDVFNAFLRERGGKEWGDKTFSARFGGHDRVAQHNVERKRIKRRPGLSTLHPEAVTGVNYYAWLGVRFQTPEEGNPGPDGETNPDLGSDPFGHSPETPQAGNPDQDQVLPVLSGSITESSPHTRGVIERDGTGGTETESFRYGDGKTMIENAEAEPAPPAAPDGSEDFLSFNPFADDGEDETCPVPAPGGGQESLGAVPGPIPPEEVPEAPEDPLRAFDASGEIGFDLETASAEELFTYGPGFVRIGGLIDSAGETATGSDMKALVEKINQAETVYGHNILGFDGLALAYWHGLDWEAFCAKAVDTDPLSRQAHPPMSRGHSSVDSYDLDHVAARYGLEGKTDDVDRLKKKHGGYDKIPLDDPEYHDYLRGDLRASRHVRRVLPETDYTRREHRIAAMMGRMTLNGFKVDRELLETRYREGQERKKAAEQELADGFGLPLGRTVMRGRGKARHEVFEPAKSPLATTEGLEWVGKLWERYGVTRPPLTDNNRLSTKAESLKAVSAHPKCPPELAHVLELMAVITTTRTVYQTALTYLAADGRVHPVVSMRQASGRASVTNPGMTVYGKHNGRHHEREIYVPDDGEVIITCDASQVDMRAIAGHCQDTNYIAMFQPGQDAHKMIATQVFGSPDFRQDAKAIGHGWNYGLGARKMIENGLDPALVKTFMNGMAERFPRLIEWREEIRERGARNELLDNGFGRMMRCDPNFAYTVAPALMGQGGARDLVFDSLLRLPESYWKYLRTFVHDEIVMSVPEGEAEEVKAVVKDAFTTEWRGVPILADTTGPCLNWGAASEK